MFIDKKPILHVVDRGTHFSAAEFLPGEGVTDIWNMFIKCLLSVYTAKDLTRCCQEFGIVMKPTPIESHNSLSVGERYHAPLRRVYNDY